jgi:hypothetical protein
MLAVLAKAYAHIPPPSPLIKLPNLASVPRADLSVLQSITNLNHTCDDYHHHYR